MNIWQYTPHGARKHGTLPPGPRMPSALQAAGWALRPLAFMDRCAERYGGIFTLRVRRSRPWVFLTDPEHVKQVFTTDAHLLRAGAGEANPLLGPLLGSRSVMLQDEPTHMTDRKRILPSFHGQRMHDYGEMMADVARREIDRWPIGEPFELWPRMQAISLEVVMRAVFSDVGGERLELLRGRMVELTNWVNNTSRLALLAAVGERSMTANPNFRNVMRPVEQLVLEEVRQRRAAGDGERHEDILAMLEQRTAAGGAPMDDEKMRDELVTFLSDGPTATSLAWAFERLLRHPDKLARLRAEVLAGESEEYVDAVVKETLRLCPAVPVVMRRLTEPMQLAGYTLPPDTIVAPCVYLMHRRADLYPQPRSFQPERFLGDSAGTYTWIPFGGGVRRCVAVVFAQLEMKRVIQAVLSEVELRPAASRSEGAARSSVSFAPDGGATVIATRRRPAGVDLPTAA
ncbi:MAG: cytochrome Cyp135B6 2 [Solirubrobacterales bacterium]|nr:cytochrome Cyp135B6 2 [Solirubrobacterales bacterium]